MISRVFFRFFLFFMVLAAFGCGQGPGAPSTSSTPTSVGVVFTPLAESIAEISGIVFDDVNASGIMDSGETGIPGVTLTLDGAQSVTTDAFGMYAFGISVLGIHSVVETDPVGYTSTTPNVVSVAATLGGIYEVDFGDIAPQPLPTVDVKPGSDKNPLNLGSKGVTPVAILGSAGLDVLLIDPGTILLEGVPPLRWAYEDVVGACAPGADADLDGVADVDCPDGFEDMVLKFDTPALAAAIGEADRGDIVTLHFAASLTDGTGISDTETVTIVKGN